jgi:hypothetical protein
MYTILVGQGLIPPWILHRGTGIKWLVQSSCGREVEGLDSPDRLYGSPTLSFDGYRGSFLGLNWPGRDVNHSPPFCYGVKNQWNYIYFSTRCVLP